jgi:hypothetical protein
VALAGLVFLLATRHRALHAASDAEPIFDQQGEPA